MKAAETKKWMYLISISSLIQIISTFAPRTLSTKTCYTTHDKQNQNYPTSISIFPSKKIRPQQSLCFTTKRHTQLSMALIPAPVTALEQALVLGVPTGEQWSAYWGRTPREQYDAIFESASVTFLGLFGSYFLSFVVGTPLATLSGGVAFFWVLLGPEFKAYQRNWELRAGRDLVDPFDEDEDEDDAFFEDKDKRGLYGAFYLSSVAHVAVVNDADTPASEEYPLPEFQDYTMEEDEEEKLTGNPYKLRLRIEDVSGRTLQVHARMSEEYLDIQPGMPVASILLSTRADFGELAALTDIWIPDVDAWVGDYPYLNKEEFRSLIGKKKMRRRLEKERWIDEDEYYEDEYYEEIYEESI